MTAVAAAPLLHVWSPGRLLEWLRSFFAATTAEIDADTLERARSGDHRAFARIVEHYDYRLRGLAFRLLGDRALMDDVLQEAYVKAFVSLPKFKGDSGVGTWLFRITYNACIDELRRGRRVVPLFDQDRVDPTAGPADLATQRHDVAAALESLPPDQRAAVLLVDAYGFDYRGAAEVLGVREGTIGSRLTRARTALRRVLNGGDE